MSNHSNLFVLLFQDEEKYGQYHSFKNQGAEFIAKLPELRELWMERLTQQVGGADGKTVIFSAEDASSPVFETALERMHGFFSTHDPNVRAIGYARHPKSFVESAFQQNLRGGIVVDMERKGLRPNYRKRFEKLDRFFGPEHVTLKEFHPDGLVGGNVVKDFAHTIGIEVPQDEEIHFANRRLSLEATALLYVQRVLGRGFVSGFPEAEAGNNLFVHKLSKIGNRKLVLSDTMIAQHLDRVTEDIDWMEARLGHGFASERISEADAIQSMDDFFDIALQCYDHVLDLAEISHSGPADLDMLVSALERIREESYEERKASVA